MAEVDPSVSYEAVFQLDPADKTFSYVRWAIASVTDPDTVSRIRVKIQKCKSESSNPKWLEI